MKLPKWLTKKRRAFIAAWVTIAVGAALWRWSDKSSAAALMGVGIFMLGKLGREWLPDAGGDGVPKPVEPEKSAQIQPKGAD